MTIYEHIKGMTIEEMAESRVSSESEVICHSNADNETYYKD